ncbi:hypothetical protein ACHAW5_000149 [Stephanodiscus triporus]|uniref:Secreted protein n=1 Tax=Stephanodiscus triporus TaxID=2934178 RepID=A0ABD3NN42_9STRA
MNSLMKAISLMVVVSSNAHKVWEPSAKLSGDPTCPAGENLCKTNNNGSCLCTCESSATYSTACPGGSSNCTCQKLEDINAMDNDFNNVGNIDDEGPRVVKGGLRASPLVVEE